MPDYQHNDPRFHALLADFDASTLANDRGTIYGLWPDLTLAFINRGWLQFAIQNDGMPKVSKEWRLGRCILDSISEPLRPFFAENYRRCLRDGRPWEHLYECSSAKLYREFHMTVFPLGDAEGLLVVNSMRREVAHDRVACPPLEALYRNEHGIVSQCSHCRRVRRVGAEPVWDWVPDWVSDQPPNTSHGLCEPCIGFHYPSRCTNREGFAVTFKT